MKHRAALAAAQHQCLGLLAVVGTAGSSSGGHSLPWCSSVPPDLLAAAPVASNNTPLTVFSV